MRLSIAKEKKGNLAYMIMWISIGGQLSTLKFDTEEEVLKQYIHLKKLGHDNIAVYRSVEVI